MKFYVSQLVETEKISPVLKKYDVGLEVTQFANAYYLENRYELIREYKKELGNLFENIDLIIHGPYADLSPGTRDPEIQRVTKLRMNQAYEVAKDLKAEKILYHNGYTPRTYSYIEWKKNVYNYWSEFIKGKEEMKIVIENVLDEDYELIGDLVNNIDEDNFCICLDIGHINAYSNLSMEKWVRALSNKIDHIHLHNNYGDRDSHFALNKGNIDIIEVLSLLNEVNKNMTVSLEITNLDELKESLDILVKEGFISLK